MNVLWPIVVLVAGAFGVWAVRYFGAPKPFEIAIIAVVCLAIIWWLLVTFAGYGDLHPVLRP
jgi:hypothetical protein